MLSRGIKSERVGLIDAVEGVTLAIRKVGARGPPVSPLCFNTFSSVEL